MFFSFFFSCFWIFFVFIWSYYLLVQMDKERGGEREGESHAAKVLMNGTRTCNMLSGQSLCVACLDHQTSAPPNSTVWLHRYFTVLYVLVCFYCRIKLVKSLSVCLSFTRSDPKVTTGSCGSTRGTGNTTALERRTRRPLGAGTSSSPHMTSATTEEGQETQDTGSADPGEHHLDTGGSSGNTESWGPSGEIQ